MSNGNHARAWPATGTMIVIVGVAIVTANWMASRRTARVDDASRAQWPDMRIDINTASPAELSLLPGLGDRLAQRIVDDRHARGRFASLDDLQRVPGIGATTIERLQAFAVCPASEAESSLPVDR